MPRSETAWNRVIRQIHKEAEEDRNYHSFFVEIYTVTPEGVPLGLMAGDSGDLTGENLHGMELALESSHNPESKTLQNPFVFALPPSRPPPGEVPRGGA